jgi:hypothetical protein
MSAARNQGAEQVIGQPARTPKCSAPWLPGGRRLRDDGGQGVERHVATIFVPEDGTYDGTSLNELVQLPSASGPR